MVKEIKKNGRKLYVCEVCGFAYEEREWAEKCQQWCSEHDTCNVEITDHAAATENEEGPQVG